ncbi:hypothetical protein ACNQ2T_00915 [Mycoplasma sp. Z407A]|uniref:hypothetical protein n=1 Tax=Mycoplasma sp. Z407A TaxID=3401678 RepID=UPI003AAF1E25
MQKREDLAKLQYEAFLNNMSCNAKILHNEYWNDIDKKTNFEYYIEAANKFRDENEFLSLCNYQEAYRLGYVDDKFEFKISYENTQNDNDIVTLVFNKDTINNFEFYADLDIPVELHKKGYVQSEYISLEEPNIINANGFFGLIDKNFELIVKSKYGSDYKDNYSAFYDENSIETIKDFINTTVENTYIVVNTSQFKKEDFEIKHLSDIEKIIAKSEEKHSASL